MQDVYIIGSHMTRFAWTPDRSTKTLAQAAIQGALTDCGARADDIDAAIFGNVAQGELEGQITIPGQVALRAAGLQNIPVINAENACATSSTGVYIAASLIRSGAADVVLVIGAEKLSHQDKSKSFEVFEKGWDVSTPAENFRALAGGYFDPETVREGGRNRSMFMDLYNMMARHHMETFATTEKMFAAVSSKNHANGARNNLAHYQKEMSVEEILAAPRVVGPLTIPMCAPLSDGGAALVLASKTALARFPDAFPVRLRASVLASGSDRDPRDYDNHITRRAATKAYEQAGVGPGDINLAEVHDAAAFGEIIQSECLGFFEFGEGGPAAVRGETALGGRIPINTSGGLESKGHPLGATGAAQLHELVTQLRGKAGARQVDGARLAIAENGGGIIGVEEAAAVVTILEAV